MQILGDFVADKNTCKNKENKADINSGIINDNAANLPPENDCFQCSNMTLKTDQHVPQNTELNNMQNATEKGNEIISDKVIKIADKTNENNANNTAAKAAKKRTEKVRKISSRKMSRPIDVFMSKSYLAYLNQVADGENINSEASIRHSKITKVEELLSSMTEAEAIALIEKCEKENIPKQKLNIRISEYFKNSFISDVKRGCKSFVQGIFPDDCNCIICNKEIPRASKYGLCKTHMELMPFNDRKICLTCGMPMENEAKYCLNCMHNHRSFDIARSSTVYTGYPAKLVALLKFHNCKWLAKYFAEIMADTYILNAYDADIIVPAPLSKERQKERGYNQSLAIAKCLSNRLNLPIAANTVIKHKHVEQQSKLTGRERHDNVKGAYSLLDKLPVKGKKVVIVDDILTTGSTANEIARQLKIAGATDVYVIVFATPKFNVPVEQLSNYEIIDTANLGDYDISVEHLTFVKTHNDINQDKSSERDDSGCDNIKTDVETATKSKFNKWTKRKKGDSSS